MTRDMWSPSRRRSFYERHPVLVETIGMIVSIAFICGFCYAAMLTL